MGVGISENKNRTESASDDIAGTAARLQFQVEAMAPDLQALKPHLVVNPCCQPTLTILCNALESGQWKALDVPAPSVVEVSRIACFVFVALTLILHPPGNP